jgi:hypothetical protein
MTFPIFQFLSHAPAPANPNAAVANGIRGIGQGIDKVQKDRQIKDQEDQFGKMFGLHANEQNLRGQQIADSENQDAAGMVLKYNQFLAAGDDASAQAMAPGMKAMGIDLVPRPGAQGMSPEDWHAQTQQATTPNLVSGDMPAEQPAQPLPKQEKPIPPLLSKFMSGAPQAPRQTEAPVDEQAASAERVRSIGGAPSPLGTIDVEGHSETPKAPETVSPGSATVEAAANPDLSQKPQRPAYEVMYRGKSMGTIDPNTFHTQHKDEAVRRGQAFVEGLPEGVANQFEPGLNVTATGPEAQDAIKNDMALILQGMRSKANRGGKGGVPNPEGGTGLLDNPKERSRLSTDMRGWVSEFTKDNDTKSLNKVGASADAVLNGLAGNPSALGERVALGRQIKELFGAAASEGERGFILSSAGELGKVEMWVKSWTDTGHIPPELMAAVRAVANRSKDYSRHRVEELGHAAADKILGAFGRGLSPEEQADMGELIVTTVAGEYGVSNPSKPKAGAAAKKPSVYR